MSHLHVIHYKRVPSITLTIYCKLSIRMLLWEKGLVFECKFPTMITNTYTASGRDHTGVSSSTLVSPPGLLCRKPIDDNSTSSVAVPAESDFTTRRSLRNTLHDMIL